MRTHSEDVRVCIELCWQCRDTCQDTFYNHCLDQGGAHVAHDHSVLMNDCIQARRLPISWYADLNIMRPNVPPAPRSAKPAPCHAMPLTVMK